MFRLFLTLIWRKKTKQNKTKYLLLCFTEEGLFGDTDVTLAPPYEKSTNLLHTQFLHLRVHHSETFDVF